MISREPSAATNRDHDLIIVGGGIYGACLALESARRGLRPLLLERADFGGATSWSSLRILHGGLRYLQTLDLRRFRESVHERRWFLKTFPELVRPQECLMPLYGDDLKRPWVFATALLANDVLSCDRNIGVEPTRQIERGRILNVLETVSRFPMVDQRGLRGAGLWYDATMLSSQRVLIEILHWACSLGATALNYVEAIALVRNEAGIVAVEARDTVNGQRYTFSSTVVCNCAGPWSAQLAAQFDRPVPEIFRPSLAFNLLLDCEPPCASAVAVTPRQLGRSAGPVYFLYPALGGVLAGTVHLPWQGKAEPSQPDEKQLQHFLADVNLAIPGLNVRLDNIVRVFAGLLPVTKERSATLSVRPVIRDHGQSGGPRGLVSVSGVKFTTARLVAEQTLAMLRRYFGALQLPSDTARPRRTSAIEFNYPGTGGFQPQVSADLNRIVREESVMTIDDLVLRRLDWWSAERNLDALRRRVSAAIKWPSEGADPSGTNAVVNEASRNAAEASA